MDIQNKKLNILMRSIELSGGAPKSTYQYLKLLKNDGHKITVLAAKGEKSIECLYESLFDRVIYTENKGFIPSVVGIPTLYKQIFAEYKSLKRKKPDFVIILGHPNAFFYTWFCNSLKIPHIIVIAGGDFSAGVELIKDCPCEHFICFSEENREALLKHFDENRITVISNRIEIKNTFEDTKHHYDFNNSNEIRILLTSRVSPDKISSIMEFIDTANHIAAGDRKIILTVAGGGESLEELKKYVANADNQFLKIEIKGHVDNLTEEFEKTHIAVGKGRSVIEPIMMNRIGCVIGDDGKLSICNEDSFQNLYRYNFSGRNIECDSPEKTLADLIESLFANEYKLDTIKETAELVSEHYSAEYLPQKLYGVLEEHTSIEQKKKKVYILPLMVKLIRYKLWRRKGKQKDGK